MVYLDLEAARTGARPQDFSVERDREREDRARLEETQLEKGAIGVAQGARDAACDKLGGISKTD